jgi:hypothetical protein
MSKAEAGKLLDYVKGIKGESDDDKTKLDTLKRMIIKSAKDNNGA